MSKPTIAVIGNKRSYYIKAACKFISEKYDIALYDSIEIIRFLQTKFPHDELDGLIRELNKFDIVSLQGINVALYPIVLNVESKVVSSFRGSDFFLDYPTLFLNSVRNELVCASDAVTTISWHMRSLLDKKFKNINMNKVSVCSHNFIEYDLLDAACLNDTKPQIFGDSKILVNVGNNSSKLHQQGKILTALNKLGHDYYKENGIYLFIHNHNNNKDLIDAINKLDIKDNIIVHNEYIEDRQKIAELRGATDIYISLPLFDAMSSVMLETVYCGAVSIIGSWMAYNDLRTYGVYDFEVNEIDEITSVFPMAVEKFLTVGKNKTYKNAIKETDTRYNWFNVFDEVINE